MKRILALVAAMSVLGAAGTTYSLKESVSGIDFDWAKSGNYLTEEGQTAETGPNENDTVVIPANVHAKLDASTDSFKLVTKLMRVTPKDGATLEITVPEGQKAELGCAVSLFGEEETTGAIVKKGLGSLELSGYGKVMDGTLVKDYYANIKVEEGKLSLYQGGTRKDEYFYFYDIEVAEKAELELCVIGYTYMKGLSGKGLVTKAQSSEVQRTFIWGSDHTVFEGRLVGKQIRIDVNAGRHDFLCPTNDINTIIINGAAIAGMTNFGETDQVLSSLGIGNVNFTGSSGSALYLGEEPSRCAKTWWVSSLCSIDGGSHGGLEIAGKLGYGESSQFYLRGFGFKGDNVNECIFSGYLQDSVSGGGSILSYITKTGSGTWRFAATNETKRSGIGVIDVKEGTLAFDSIAEKGVDSSLGPGDLWYAPTYGLASAGTPVDYAFVLGGTDDGETEATEGTMSYTGSKIGVCTTRPFAVRSRGRIKSVNRGFYFAGATALGAGEKKLVLESTEESSSANFATRLADGGDGGKLSVEKDGAGTWCLHGANTATGSLFARRGTMLINNSSSKKYRFYRFVVTQNAYTCDRYDTTYSVGKNNDGTPKPVSDYEKRYVQILRVALYDANGKNLLLHFKQKDPITQFDYATGDANIMETNEVAIASLSTIANFIDPTQKLDNICNTSGYAASGGLNSSYGGIYTNKPETHLPIVFRLPDDAAPAVRLDFACGRNADGSVNNPGSYNGRNMTAFRLDASADGINWDLGIAQNEEVDVPEKGASGLWDSDLTSSTSSAIRKDKGMELGASETENNVAVHSYAFSSYGAANGATVKVVGDPIELDGLRVDASQGAGNIENFTLAANGTLEVLNLYDGAKDAILPVNIIPVGASLAESGVSAWKVNINGKPSNWKCTVTKDGKIRITPAGVYLIVR